MDQRSIYTTYPPQLSPEQKDYLVTTVKNWTIHHGLAVRPSPELVSNASDSNEVLATNAPVTLFPSLFPRSCFELAVSIQTTYNELYAAIAADEPWLRKIVEDLVDVDDFVANLWRVHNAVKQEGYVQPLSLGLFRSDYMLHTPEESNAPSLKQVEFNTISSSFGGLSCLVSKMHSSLLPSFSLGNSIAYPLHPCLKENSVPENTAVATLAAGLAAAYEAYGPAKSSPGLPLCVLFVVQGGERNLFDQLELSTQLSEFHKIPVFRVITSDVMRLTSIPQDNPSRPLIYTPAHAPSTQFEVTTVYLRGFYDPKDYPDDSAWNSRIHLERSAAIKCPTVLSQLSGCKKVQQVLAQLAGPDHLSRFLSGTDPELVQQLRATFAPQYDISSPGEGRNLALDPSTARNHVLKPQREGGGNNVYRDAIPKFLHSMPESDWKGWILMELIQPPTAAKNVALRSDGEVLTGNVIGELGVFGTVLWNNDTGNVLRNEQGGWLMRTKAQDSDEGGVAAGFSSLDSVLLFDSN
ncbi:Glutathione synthetase [Ophidiomyces ophidiicola]|nr:Glutathione synthetase [Ophidiomyces ophidiicola]